MNENSHVDHVDVETLGYEVASDEALERAAAVEEAGAAFTLGSCTGLSVCPG
jgi:hypothetical protein